jgi:N-carbamoyl-L-amino-acid hydrolase
MGALSEGSLLARRMLQRLAEETADPPGVTRAAYGPGEQFAHDLARAEAEALGAIVATDAAGNLYMTLPGTEPHLPALMVGSHLDSVPHGGNFDGSAGVAAGLAVLAEVAARRLSLRRDLTVVALRAEEAAWFPLSYPGSMAALGLLPAEALEARRSDTGRTLADHMKEAGFDPDAVRDGLPQIEASRVEAFIEIHIEQAPRLVRRDRPVAVVTAINGGFRHVDARCLGAYAHSGAEPRFSRRDALLGFVDLVHGMEAVWDRLEAAGEDATITFGRVQSDSTQHGGSRVLGEIRFTLDVRSPSEALLESIAASLAALCEDIGRRRGVRFEFDAPMTWAPAGMDAVLVDRFERSASKIGLDLPRLSSGAGHDAAAFAGAGIASAMLFVRNRNGSHNPDESLDPADLNVATRLLLAFVTDFDNDLSGSEKST